MDGMIIRRIVKFSFIRNLRQMDDLDEQELFRYFRAMEYVHVEFFVPRVKWAQSLDSNINYCQGRKEVDGEVWEKNKRGNKVFRI